MTALSLPAGNFRASLSKHPCPYFVRATFTVYPQKVTLGSPPGSQGTGDRVQGTVATPLNGHKAYIYGISVVWRLAILRTPLPHSPAFVQTLFIERSQCVHDFHRNVVAMTKESYCGRTNARRRLCPGMKRRQAHRISRTVRSREFAGIERSAPCAAPEQGAVAASR